MYVGLTVRLGQIVNASAVTVVLSVLGVPGTVTVSPGSVTVAVLVTMAV